MSSDAQSLNKQHCTASNISQGLCLLHLPQGFTMINTSPSAAQLHLTFCPKIFLKKRIQHLLRRNNMAQMYAPLHAVIFGIQGGIYFSTSGFLLIFKCKYACLSFVSRKMAFFFFFCGCSVTSDQEFNPGSERKDLTTAREVDQIVREVPDFLF